MRWHHRLLLRFRSLFRKNQADRELDDEIQFHLQQQIDEYAAQGMSREEARYAALRSLDGMQQIKEECRQARHVNFVGNSVQDLRFGCRILRRNPGFSILTVLCLTVGIGATAAVVSWIEGVLFRPFPAVAHQERMVAITGTEKGGFDKGWLGCCYTDLSWPDLLDFRRSSTLMDWFIVDRITGTTLNIGDRAEHATGSVVSSNYFAALGIHPFLGRGFTSDEDWGRNGHPVTVISYWLWKERFHADPEIIGKKQMLNGVPHTIVGVAPEGFYGTFVGYPMQFWVPVSMQEKFTGGVYQLEDRGGAWIEGFARLNPGVTIEQAQAEISAITKRLESEYPATNRGRGAKLFPLWKTPFNQAGTLAPTLEISLVAVFFVLLIACANVSGLLLVRSLARQHEMTVRMAVGCRRGRLLRQLLTEGLILSLLAGAGGLAVAYFCRNLLAIVFPLSSVIATNLSGHMDWRVLAFSAGVCVVSTLMFALVPAFQTSRLDIAGALKAESATSFGSRAKSRVRSTMVLVQVALSFVLLVGGTLLMRSLQRLRTADPGFATDNVVATHFDLVGAGYDAPRAKRFRDDLLERVQALPGVQSAAWEKVRPFSYAGYFSAPISVDGYQPAPDERPTVDYNQVGPGYFATMEIPILSGREFSRSDNETTVPAVIVNEQMVAKYWYGADPVGKRIQLNDQWLHVVGVARNSRYSSFVEGTKPFLYVCMGQIPGVNADLVMRTAQAPGTLDSALSQEIHSLDPGLGLEEVITMRDHMNLTALATQQIVVALLTIFGGIALLLAAVGVYGVLAYSVSQSKRELGLRMALGAGASNLFRVVMTRGLVLSLGGILLGAIAAVVLTRFIALGRLLYRVNPRDPAAFGTAILAMVAISLAACFLPAWRAARTNPLQALRD
ncbi:MAG TPA: ABC transporter permease [Candidatus Angelobacter sp.]